MTKKSLLLPAAMLAMAAPGVLFADNPAPATTDYGIKFGGFVKIDAFNDDHTVYGARQDMFLFYAAKRQQTTSAPAVLDTLGGAGTATLATYLNNTDLNKKSQTVFTGVQTRLTGKITAPDAFGAKVTGLIEGDFFGVAEASIATFDLRHAWINFAWGDTSVRVGQDWHPLFSAGGVTPNTIQFNPITPIHPFGRAPMVSATQKMGDLKLAAFAIEQSYHTEATLGSAAGSQPLSNNKYPEAALQLSYDANGLTFGGTFDVKAVRPFENAPMYGSAYSATSTCTNTTNTAAATGDNCYLITGQNGNSMVARTTQVFAKLKMDDLTIKASVTKGQDLSSTNGSWGYAVRRDYLIDLTPAGTAKSYAQAYTKKQYTPYNTIGYWGEISYGKDVEFGLVAGTIKNLGTTSAIDSSQVAVNRAGNDIRALTTIAPHVKLTSGKTWVAAEYIYSAVQYMEDERGYKYVMQTALANGGSTAASYNTITAGGLTFNNPAVRDDNGRINKYYTSIDHRIQLSINQSF